ncbi:protein of unknown function [Nitrosotalea devaniterrae]|uniref:Uncharacterized protein n=1 Tax=Nitrosotalea devaniterrae TaxID=1078905 RepID=A0A128A638_9ARCH|nr:protein of unknown function [Candidatus Nitrosotalea devanaterra]
MVDEKMVDIHTPDGAVKLLTDWIVENMYEEIKNRESTDIIDITPSELLDKIVSLYQGDELHRIIRTAVFDAIENVKSDKVTDAHEKFIEGVAVDTPKDKAQNIIESKVPTKKKTGKSAKISGIVIAICAVIIITSLVHTDSKYWGLTDTQRSKIKAMENTCDANGAAAWLQSGQYDQAFHDRCYGAIDSQIQQFRSLNQK